MSTYLEFSSPEFGAADTNGARPMMPGGGGSFKLCGKNPGVIVTAANEAVVTLHADESGDPNQRFFMRVSATKDPPRVLRNDGNAVTNGRAKNEKIAPVLPGMVPGVTMPGARGGVPGRMAPTHRAPHNYGRVVPPKSVEEMAAGRAVAGSQDTKEESVDTRMQTMGIMFLIIAITILLICAAVVLRRKLVQEPSDDKEKKKEPSNETK